MDAFFVVAYGFAAWFAAALFVAALFHLAKRYFTGGNQ